MENHSKALEQLRIKRDKLIAQRDGDNALVVLEQMIDLEPTASRYTRKAMQIGFLQQKNRKIIFCFFI